MDVNCHGLFDFMRVVIHVANILEEFQQKLNVLLVDPYFGDEAVDARDELHFSQKIFNKIGGWLGTL